MQKINLVILGHVDHGKSTLIGRLLYDAGAIMPEKFQEIVETSKKLGRDTEFAFLADNLEEEREDAMTIDIIHTPFKSKNEYTIIDCPGHKEFIKNMLTGASQAEVAVLVLSAKAEEGIQEQTKRHLFLANMFGIKQLFVAINKMDVINYSQERFEFLKKELGKVLDEVGFKERVFFVPISAKQGDNVFKKSEKISWYKGNALIDILDKNITLIEFLINKPLRFLVQDVYNFGDGKVIVGKIETGKLEINSKVLFNLSKQRGFVSSIMVSNEEKNVAIAGENIGFLCKDVNMEEIKRGEVVSEIENPPEIKKEFNSKIFLMGDVELTEKDSLVLRCGTKEETCKIEILERFDSGTGKVLEKKEFLEPTDAAGVKIITNAPIAIEKFSNIPALGRFLLIKKNNIAAAGIIK